MRIQTSLTHLAAAVTLALAVATTAAAQQADRPDTSHAPVRVPDFIGRGQPHARVVLLGVFHFDNPGLDSYKQRFPFDPMTPAHQRQIEDVVERLARFHPNRIVVESRNQRRMDSLYTEYVAGRWALGPSEVFQIGFRLAKRLALPRVYAADTWSGMYEKMTDAQYDSLVKLHPPADTSMYPRFTALYRFMDSLKTALPLPQYLTVVNDPAVRRDYLANYLVGDFAVRNADDYFGPDFGTRWWNRNLRIFSNVQKITEGPGDRILVIFGSGHMPLLQHAFWASPEYELEDVRDYLTGKE